MTADKQLKAYIDRVLRLKEEQDALGQDIRDVYAEAKAEGYDKTVMGKLVAHLRKVLKEGDGAIAEAESIFDTYLHAYQRASGTAVAIAHTHEEEFDPITGEFVNDNSETHQRPSTNDKPSQEAGPQAEASPAGTGAGTLADREGRFEGEAASADLSTNPEIDPNEDREEGHSLDGNVGANAGGDHVNRSVERASGRQQDTHTLNNRLDGVPVQSVKKPLRPLCRNPGDNCGGYGSTHCAYCLRASKQAEVAA